MALSQGFIVRVLTYWRAADAGRFTHEDLGFGFEVCISTDDPGNIGLVHICYEVEDPKKGSDWYECLEHNATECRKCNMRVPNNIRAVTKLSGLDI